MKMVFTMILLLALYDASAFEVKVSRMTKSQGLEARFDLKTSLNEKVVLDCQSFIQGLLFGQHGEDALMLEEWECQELMTDMLASMRAHKKHCLLINEERGVLDAQHTCP